MESMGEKQKTDFPTLPPYILYIQEAPAEPAGAYFHIWR